jgi:1-acyl-sn-glycerol-3-phosphate acyltransferase
LTFTKLVEAAMAKQVLGNDPFQRGAAARPAPEQVSEAPLEAKPSRSSPAKQRAVRPARAAAEVLEGASQLPFQPSVSEAVLPPPTLEASGEAVALRADAPGEDAGPVQAGAEPQVEELPATPRASPFSLAGLRELLAAAESRYRATTLGQAASRGVVEVGHERPPGRALLWATDFLHDRYFRVELQGTQHLPDGPALLVVNHSGAIPYDGPVLCRALQRARPDLQEPRWLMMDQASGAPLLGKLLRRLWAVRASTENASRLLAQRRPVVVFPEGLSGIGKPFSQRYQLRQFGRGGFVKLALRSGAPIIPVAVLGAEESTPLLARLPGSPVGLPYVPVTPLGLLPLPAKWRIRFGPPLDTSGLAASHAEDPEVVQRLVGLTREAVSEMLWDLQRSRHSVFAG